MDPYAALGVPRNATPDELKAAFRAKAREHHPDRNPDDPDAQRRFQEINAAFQLLSDPGKRSNFDRYGQESAPRPSPRSAPGGFEDLFSEIFGGRGTGRQRSSGETVDIERSVELSFEESALGCTKSVSYERLDHCSVCDGSGGAPGTQLSVCRSCRGAGRVAVSMGFFGGAAVQSCPQCAGRGRVPSRPCGACAGKGLELKRRSVDVTVPPGIESGARQSVSGGGNRPAPAHPAGDLVLHIRVQRHAEFRREADDVISVLAIPFALAALGGELAVRTVHGETKLSVASGTQSGSTISLRDQGMPHRFRRGRGSHVFEVAVVVPSNLSPKARELVAEYAKLMESSGDASLFSALKSWFE